MKYQKIVWVVVICLILFLNYLITLFLTQLLNIENVTFKSMTGITPNINGKIMLFIVLTFLEILIGSKIYEKKQNKNDL